MTLDDSKATFDRLLPRWLTQKAAIENEQDTRFQVIDRILTEVMDWAHEEVKNEPNVPSGYVDYLLTAQARNRCVVEAKCANRLLIDTRRQEVAYYKLSGAALKSATDGVQQAQRYCADSGVTFAVLTSGFEWIFFLAVREDGKPPADGRAIVFPNLESIEQNFALFHDLLSKEAVLKQLYKIRLAEVEGTQARQSDPLMTPINSRSDLHLMQKSKLGLDLEHFFKGFFTSMTGDSDPEMLAKCFVESKESRETDASLVKITRNLVNQLEVMGSNRGAELETHIKDAVESKKGGEQ